jgi:hypothetical protein
VADEAVRELERLFRVSGSVEDEAKWLSARVRAGELAREALATLGFLGHAAALAASGEPAPQPWEQEDVLARLRPLGKEWVVRATIALARSVSPYWRAVLPGDGSAAAVLDAASAWALCPCDSHRDAAKRAAEDRAVLTALGGARRNQDLERALEAVDGSDLDDAARARAETEAEERFRRSPGQEELLEKAGLAAGVILASASAAANSSAVGAGMHFVSALRWATVESGRFARNAGRVQAAEARRIILAELAPWALGAGDPLGGAPPAEAAPGLSDSELASLRAVAPLIGRDPAAVATVLRQLAGDAACEALGRALGEW